MTAAPARECGHEQQLRDAWREYLELTRKETQPRYDEVEAWAWARLQTRLRVLQRARARSRSTV